MALKKKNWVWQTTTTAGTGALTLAAGATTGHRTFSAAGFVDGDTAVVTFSGRTSGAKETQVCTINISGPTTTVTRNTLIDSTTGSTISWNGVETVDVYLAPVSSKTRTNDEPIDLQDRVDVASATTCAIYDVNSNYVRLTGTTTVAGFGSPTTTTGLTSMWRHVVAAAATPLTSSASLIIPGGNITTAAGDTFTVVYEGSGVSRIIGYQRADGTSLAASTASLTRTARTSNTILGAADRGNLIDITANSFTQTFSAAASLGSGWFAYVRNSGSGVVTLDPNSTETIDGQSTVNMYPQEMRLIECDGSNFVSQVIHPFRYSSSSTFTFVMPSGYTAIDVDLVGGGGGGGSGRRGAAGGVRGGGAGGGGGARQRARLVAPAAGTSVTVTVGTGGPGGAAISTNDTNGGIGTAGGTTTFGSYLSAYGGAPGEAGTNGAVSGGSGGGALSTGNSSKGGYPSSGQLGTSAYPYNVGLGGGLGRAAANVPGSAEWGGGGGSGNGNGADAISGAGSLYGGAGGGGGGSIDAGNTSYKGGPGGLAGTWDDGTGTVSTSGVAGGTTGGGAGNPGAAGSGMVSGGGGSGGGAGGGTGGAGGAPGGGGGGGGASLNGTASGAGGAGGDGRAIVIGVA